MGLLSLCCCYCKNVWTGERDGERKEERREMPADFCCTAPQAQSPRGKGRANKVKC